MFPGPFRPKPWGRTPAATRSWTMALEAAPDYETARWHSGYVRVDNHWVKFDEVSASAPQNKRLAAYRRPSREKSRETEEDQMALAAWCKKAGLPDQWRAHLGNILTLNPDHQEARALLGYQRVGGVWLTPAGNLGGQCGRRQPSPH